MIQRLNVIIVESTRCVVLVYVSCFNAYCRNKMTTESHKLIAIKPCKKSPESSECRPILCIISAQTLRRFSGRWFKSSSVSDWTYDSGHSKMLSRSSRRSFFDNCVCINWRSIFLRTCRIDLVIEVRFPDASARIHIFDICTEHLLQNGLMEADVDIDRLTRATNGLIGAHIKRIVLVANINAVRRDILSRRRLDITGQ